MIDRNVELKCQLLDRKLQLADASAAAMELQETKLSGDKKTMNVSLSQLVPFDVETISRVSWSWGYHEFADYHFKPVCLQLEHHMPVNLICLFSAVRLRDLQTHTLSSKSS